MRKKRFLMLSIFTILAIIITSSLVVNAIEFPDVKKILDPDIPDSWYQEPQTASELNIEEFNQSPMLDKKVAKGELPPVVERLPEDPIVIEPYQEIGKYGGTIVSTGSDFGQHLLNSDGPSPLKIAPDCTTVFPWYAKDYEFADDYSWVTITFRKGLKWSDGTPFIPKKEYQFYWDHYINNEKLFDLVSAVGDPGITELPLKDITFAGDYTVTLHIKPNPNEIKNVLTKSWTMYMAGSIAELAPAHFMKQYNPDFVGEEKALARVKELGFQSLVEGYNNIRAQAFLNDDVGWHPEFNVPTMRAYIPVKRTETEILLERNPYYFAVDPEGNQLPYIDKIRRIQTTNRKTAEIKAVTGQLDFANTILRAGNIPLYKQNEEKGDYKTLIYKHTSPAKPYFMFNFNTENEEYAQIFQNIDFRKAMSLSINRNEINNRFYFDQGTPAQLTVPVVNEMFKKEYATSYADFKPEQARELLDKIGLKDVNGDGYRETPAGNEFKPKLMVMEAPYLGEINLHELVISMWEEVGINVELDNLGESGSLFWENSVLGDFEIKPHILDVVVPVMGEFPIGAAFAPISANACSPWLKWGKWMDTGGEKGIEPPEQFKELSYLARDYLETGNKKALEKLVKSQAENLWVIGTVGYQPVPVIVKNRVKNVPQRGLYSGAGAQRMLIYNPVQFYLEQ